MSPIRDLQQRFFDSEAGQKLDALLISKAENIGYLSGFWGTFGRLLLTRTKALLLSDARYSEMARKLCQKENIDYLEIEKKAEFWPELLRKLGIKQLGFEAAETSVERFEKMAAGFNGVKLHSTFDAVEGWRMQKTAEEISLISRAAEITDQTLEHALAYIHEGVSEAALAWTLEKIAREEFGAEGVSFPPIVAFGANSAIPHHQSTALKLTKNQPLLIDFGVQYQHYCSDMTRCFFFGNPTEEWLQKYVLVLAAQEHGIAAMCAGANISGAEKAARAVFAAEAINFNHSFGHGVGLEIHEAPHLSADTKDIFAADMIVTAEPGLYTAGAFGIRIEDLIRVTDGQPEILSHFPKAMEALRIG